MATFATTGVARLSNVSISLERIFSKVNSMNNVHFYITFKLPVVGGIDAGVQTADIVIASSQKKQVERTIRELR